MLPAAALMLLWNVGVASAKDEATPYLELGEVLQQVAPKSFRPRGESHTLWPLDDIEGDRYVGSKPEFHHESYRGWNLKGRPADNAYSPRNTHSPAKVALLLGRDGSFDERSAKLIGLSCQSFDRFAAGEISPFAESALRKKAESDDAGGVVMWDYVWTLTGFVLTRDRGTPEELDYHWQRDPTEKRLVEHSVALGEAEMRFGHPLNADARLIALETGLPGGSGIRAMGKTISTTGLDRWLRPNRASLKDSRRSTRRLEFSAGGPKGTTHTAVQHRLHVVEYRFSFARP